MVKQFTSAARTSTAVTNPVDIQFMWDDIPFTAHPPTTGQLVLLMATDTDGPHSVLLRAVLEFMEGLLDEDDFAMLREHIREGGDIDTLGEIMEWLVAEWSARPTKSRSASPRSPRTTGKRSTAKTRSEASVAT